MGTSISVSKQVVSKLALLQALMHSNTVCSIDETDTDWILTGKEQNLADLYQRCIEEETRIQIEASVGELRKTLYQKAFAPISGRESSL